MQIPSWCNSAIRASALAQKSFWVRFLVKVTPWVAGLIPAPARCVREETNQCVSLMLLFLSFSFPLFPSLLSIKLLYGLLVVSFSQGLINLFCKRTTGLLHISETIVYQYANLQQYFKLTLLITEVKPLMKYLNYKQIDKLSRVYYMIHDQRIQCWKCLNKII